MSKKSKLPEEIESGKHALLKGKKAPKKEGEEKRLNRQIILLMNAT